MISCERGWVVICDVDWEAEPDVDRVVDGVPNRVDRIKSLGNAVAPQLVQRIGELVYAEHHRSARD